MSMILFVSPKKSSTLDIFEKLNSFDHRRFFSKFIENAEIKLKKKSKKGLDTVLTNHENDVSALKYKLNMFTNLNRTRDFSSDSKQFENSLNE
jgi:hypothetical protein